MAEPSYRKFPHLMMPFLLRISRQPIEASLCCAALISGVVGLATGPDQLDPPTVARWSWVWLLGFVLGGLGALIGLARGRPAWEAAALWVLIGAIAVDLFAQMVTGNHTAVVSLTVFGLGLAGRCWLLMSRRDTIVVDFKEDR